MVRSEGCRFDDAAVGADGRDAHLVAHRAQDAGDGVLHLARVERADAVFDELVRARLPAEGPLPERVVLVGNEPLSAVIQPTIS
jgi:hypothetical protein